MPDVVVHAQSHRPRFLGGTDPLRALGYYEYKVFADANALDGNLPDEATIVSVGEGKFIFEIPEDLDGTELVVARAFVTTAGSVSVDIVNDTQSVGLLSTPITIESGLSSRDSSVPPVIVDDLPVDDGDQIWTNVLEADGVAKGLGIILAFASL